MQDCHDIFSTQLDYQCFYHTQIFSSWQHYSLTELLNNCCFTSSVFDPTWVFLGKIAKYIPNSNCFMKARLLPMVLSFSNSLTSTNQDGYLYLRRLKLLPDNSIIYIEIYQLSLLHVSKIA